MAPKPTGEVINISPDAVTFWQPVQEQSGLLMIEDANEGALPAHVGITIKPMKDHKPGSTTNLLTLAPVGCVNFCSDLLLLAGMAAEKNGEMEDFVKAMMSCMAKFI